MGWPRMHEFFFTAENGECRVYAEVFATKARRQKVPRSFFDVLYSPFGEIWLATNSRIDYRGEVEKIEFAQRLMKKMLRLLGANRHFLIPYFYFLIIYSRSFLFMRDRQFNNRIPYFTPRCRGWLFYIGYSTFYISPSFLSQKNLPEKFIPLNLLKYLAI